MLKFSPFSIGQMKVHAEAANPKFPP